MPQFLSEFDLHQTIRVDVERLESDINVIRQTTTEWRSPIRGTFETRLAKLYSTSLDEATPSTRELVLDDSNYAKYIAGRESDYRFMQMGNADFFERLRTEGFDHESFRGVRDDVYTALVTLGYPLDYLIYIDSANFGVYDRFGTIMPTAIRFDYIGTLIDETHYKLDALARYLVSRDDIIVRTLSSSGDSRYERGTETKDAKRAISRIPAYNADKGQTLTIKFAWQPTPKLWKNITSILPPTAAFNLSVSRLQQFVLSHDILNIAQFRIPSSIKSHDYR